MPDIENPMVVDRLWRHFEEEPKVFSVCAGCEDEIYMGEDILEFENDIGDTVYLHAEDRCAYQYVARQSVRKAAGE